MDLATFENAYSISLPQSHRQAMTDASNPIHEACDFLVFDSPYELLRIHQVNQWLHSSEYFDSWPDDLVAFASNGCGDYFAYDTRNAPYVIRYIDPDRSVIENLSMDDGFTSSSFEDWCAEKCERNPRD